MRAIWNNITNNITWFFRRLKRVRDFLPYIWRGYDFDYHYSIGLFVYQLERQAKFLESDRAYTMDSLHHASRIRTAIKLLNKVYEDEYDMEWMDKLEEIYGPKVLDWHFIPIAGTDNVTMMHEYEWWDNKDEVEKTKEKLAKESREKQKRAEELVWKFIAHNIRYWWD
jgi:hypothetical protein